MESFLPKDYPDFEEFGAPPCSESFPDAFFPDDAPDGSMVNRGTYTYEREAKMMCLSCPYMARCLKYAVDNPDLTGIWGGTNERQRKLIRSGRHVSLNLPSSRNR